MVSKAQELENHFSLQNQLDIHKALWKYFSAVIKLDKNRCREHPEQVAEICFLLQCCSSSEYSFEVDSISNEILVHLCELGYIKKDFLLRNLLSISATARNFTSIVNSIWQILMIEIAEQMAETGSYICNYKISSPPHPFVTLSLQRPDCCCTIIDHIKEGYIASIEEHDRITEHILPAIKPFLQFILLNPNRSKESWEGLALHSTMIGLIRCSYVSGARKIAYDLAVFLIHLNLYRKVDASSITDTVAQTEQIVEALLVMEAEDSVVDMLIQIGNHILCQCQKLLDAGHSIKSSLRLLKKLFFHQPQVLLGDESIFLLAMLLYRSPSIYREDVLKIVLHILPSFLVSGSTTNKLDILQLFHLPLLKILFGGWHENEEHARCQKIASNIFKNIQQQMKAEIGNRSEVKQDNIEEQKVPKRRFRTMELVIVRQHYALLRQIHRSREAAKDFLMAFKDLPNPCDSLILVLSTLVVNSIDKDLMDDVLNCIANAAKLKPHLAMDFLSLLLHTSNNRGHPVIAFKILDFLPKLTLQKQLVPAILKIVRMFGKSNSLLSLTIRMTTEIWKKQPRVFPHLLQLLSKNINPKSISSESYKELLIARAASILDVCKLRPAQNGAELVGLLAKIFDDFGQAQKTGHIDSSTVECTAMFGLEALKSLCEAEVVEISTAWSVISPKLRHSTSPLIVKSIISLFSICPSVLGRSTSEMIFREDAGNFIWKNVEHENAEVVSCALAALANYSQEEFIVEKLPTKVRTVAEDMLLKKYKVKKKQDDDLYDPSKERITGPAYLLLLQSLKGKSALGSSVLLSKLLTQEVSSLPRNISSANAASRFGSAHDKHFDRIPEFLKSLHEKSKRPALIPGIAYGLLCSFKSSPKIGKNEKIGRRHLIDDAKVYRQMLDNCLNEIVGEQLDWHHLMMATSAWTHMMCRVFDVVVEGRRAELSLLFDQGKLDSEESLKIDTKNAIFWTRDQLVSQLLKASRGNPMMQGNSILALAGLASKVSKLYLSENLESQEMSVQYTNNRDWLIRVADTIMVVFDGNLKPKSEPMQWCQQASSNKSTASSLLARTCAAVALSEIAVTLISIDPDRVELIFSLIKSRIAGQEKAGSSLVMQFSCGVALGFLANRLQQARYSDIAGADGHLMISKAVHVLEETSYNNQLQNREGSMIGLGLALAASFSTGTQDSRVHGAAALERLFNMIGNTVAEETLTAVDEAAFLSITVATVNGFAVDCVKVEFVMKVIDAVELAVQKWINSSTLSSSLGMLLHGAVSTGLARAQDLMQSAVDAWLKTLTNEFNEPAGKIAAVYGLMSAFGCNRFISQFDESDIFDPALKNKLTVVMGTIQQMINSSDDTMLCLHCAKLLGLLHLAHYGTESRKTDLPSNYNYLPDSSLLRALFNALLEAGKSGPLGAYSSEAVCSIVESLIASSVSALPPVNWTLVLSPLMKLGFDREARRLCLRFAILNASSCIALSTWLASWLNPSIFVALEDICKAEIFEHLDDVTKIIPIQNLKTVLEILPAHVFKREDKQLQKLIIIGLTKVADLKNPVQSSLLYVKNALEKIAIHTDALQMDEEILKQIANCLLHLPKELEISFTNNVKSCELTLVLTCMMVAHHGSPLKVLSASLDWLLTNPKPWSLLMLKYALQRHFLKCSSNDSQNDEMIWFLDQIGKSRKLVNTREGLKSLCYLINLMSSSAAIWSMDGYAVPMSSYSQNAINEFDDLCTFGKHLDALLQQPKLKHLQQNIMEWLIGLIESIPNEESFAKIGNALRDALVCLRHTEPWRTQKIWTKSLDLMPI